MKFFLFFFLARHTASSKVELNRMKKMRNFKTNNNCSACLVSLGYDIKSHQYDIIYLPFPECVCMLLAHDSGMDLITNNRS